MRWTREKIAALAPDRPSLDRAAAIAAPRRWRGLAHDDRLLWGQARSSGATYYRCVIDLEKQRYHCSCPNPKAPCKHVLALLLLHHDQAGAFQLQARHPDWVDRWLERRDRPADPEAEAARAQQRAQGRRRHRDQRLERMQAGAADLEQWLGNLIVHGLAEAQQQDVDYWEDMAARMVDAKLSSIANRIRQWPDLLLRDDWPEALLREIAELYLFARGFQRLDQLPEALQQTLRTTGGISIKKEMVLKGKEWPDHWLIIGQREGSDERLAWRRTWLLGESSGRQALLLDFAWGNQPFESDWRVGTAIAGALCFYPGARESRALVKHYEVSTEPYDAPTGDVHLDAFFDDYARAIGANPWRYAFPAYLEAVIPTWEEEGLLLVDRRRKMVPAATATEDHWRLIALSAGWPIRVFGEWDGRQLTVLSAMAGDRLVRV